MRLVLLSLAIAFALVAGCLSPGWDDSLDERLRLEDLEVCPEPPLGEDCANRMALLAPERWSASPGWFCVDVAGRTFDHGVVIWWHAVTGAMGIEYGFAAAEPHDGEVSGVIAYRASGETAWTYYGWNHAPDHAFAVVPGLPRQGTVHLSLWAATYEASPAALEGGRFHTVWNADTPPVPVRVLDVNHTQYFFPAILERTDVPDSPLPYHHLSLAVEGAGFRVEVEHVKIANAGLSYSAGSFVLDEDCVTTP